MRRLLKVFVLILFLAQIPFAAALYRAYALRAYLDGWPAARREAPFEDLRGGIHIHSAAGGHSLGQYPEIIQAAKELGYRYAFITEHPRSPILFRPVEDPALTLIYGWEQEEFENARVLTDAAGRVRFATHLQRETMLPDWQGLEIFNLHENAEAADNWRNRILFLYHRFFEPRLFYFQLWQIDRERLQLWDRLLAERFVAGLAGNDAHQNVGILVQTAAGKSIFSLVLDPYRDSLGFVTTHVLLQREEQASAALILQALARGSSYVCFEAIADPTGFSFHGRRGNVLFPMGSRVPPGTELEVQSPVPVRFEILKDGRPLQSLEGSRFRVVAREPGAYRVEAYPLNPPALLRGKPWILSNPILVGR